MRGVGDRWRLPQQNLLKRNLKTKNEQDQDTGGQNEALDLQVKKMWDHEKKIIHL
jgi:hypothetical protein